VNSIQRIKDDVGNLFTNEEDIGEVLIGFFSDLFTSPNPSNMDDVASIVDNRVDAHGKNHLTRDFTEKEVKETPFQMHPTKAPREDGTPTIFF